MPEAPADTAQSLDRDLEAAIGTAIEAVKAELQGVSGQPGAPGHVDADPAVNKYIVEARAVEAGEGRRQRRRCWTQTLYRGADALRVSAALLIP